MKKLIIFFILGLFCIKASSQSTFPATYDKSANGLLAYWQKTIRTRLFYDTTTKRARVFTGSVFQIVPMKFQENFDNETGGSLMSKDDTLKGSNHNLNILSMPVFRLDTSILIYGIYGGAGKGNDTTNTVFGRKSLTFNNPRIVFGTIHLGQRNTALGTNTLFANVDGSGNTALGYKALRLNNADDNVAIGDSALSNNTTGSNNIAIGNGAASGVGALSGNIAIGTSALSNMTSGGGIGIGAGALKSLLGSGGSGLIAIGGALVQGSTGANNIAIGDGSMGGFLITGQHNIAIGNTTLNGLTSGIFNVAIGSHALQTNSTGEQNTAIGTNALLNNTTAIKNVAIGAGAMETNTTGGFNTAVGEDVLLSNTTGVNNVTMGWLGLAHNTTGTDNTAIGWRAGHGITTGTYNIFLGDGAGDDGAGAQKVDATNSIGIGANVVTTASNQIVIGNSSHTQVLLFGVVSGVGTKAVRYDPSTNKLTYADTATGGGGSGNTNTNIGAALRIAIVGTNQLKTIHMGIDMLGDSTQHANEITIDADTTTNDLHLATQGFVRRLLIADSINFYMEDPLFKRNDSTMAIRLGTNSVDGYISAADHTLFGNKENALTFSTGLTRTTNTITSNLSTGVSGGQTLVGSTSTNSGLTIKSTTGVGASGADIIFKIGNNGATEAMRILNSGNVGIGDASPASLFTVGSGDKFQVDGNGNILKLNNITTSFPSSQGDPNTVLLNDGSGNLSWVLPGGTIVAHYDNTGLTSTTTNFINYTTPNIGFMTVIDVSCHVTTTIVSAGVLTITVTYKDETNVSRTSTFVTMFGTSGVTTTGVSDYPVMGELVCYPNTAVTATATLTVGTMTYNLSSDVRFIRQGAGL